MSELSGKQPVRRVPMEIWSRVVGYLRPVQNWAKHKQLEFDDRKTYSLGKAVKRAEEGK